VVVEVTVMEKDRFTEVLGKYHPRMAFCSVCKRVRMELVHEAVPEGETLPLCERCVKYGAPMGEFEERERK
jgi:hypothetical protein